MFNPVFSLVEGKVAYSKYVQYWAILYVISTILIVIFVKEAQNPDSKISIKNVGKSYKGMFRLLLLRVRNLV